MGGLENQCLHWHNGNSGGEGMSAVNKEGRTSTIALQLCIDVHKTIAWSSVFQWDLAVSLPLGFETRMPKGEGKV